MPDGNCCHVPIGKNARFGTIKIKYRTSHTYTSLRKKVCIKTIPDEHDSQEQQVEAPTHYSSNLFPSFADDLNLT